VLALRGPGVVGSSLDDAGDVELRDLGASAARFDRGLGRKGTMGRGEVAQPAQWRGAGDDH
jgi:hypothetical protein